MTELSEIKSSSTAIVPGEIRMALGQVRDLTAVPAGDLRDVPEISALFNSVDRFISSGGARDPVFELIAEARDASDDPARGILSLALLRRGDHRLARLGLSRLATRRCDWTGQSTALVIPDLQVDLSIAGRKVVPGSLRTGEGSSISLLTEIEIFGEAKGDLGSTPPAADQADGHFGELGQERSKGFIRSVGVGKASCLLTDQRLIAVLFDSGEASPGDGLDLERPFAAMGPKVSTVLVLSADRDQFTGCEFQDAERQLPRWPGQSRFPAINLLGTEADFYLRPKRLLGRPGRLSNPRRRLQDLVVDFVGGT